MGDRSGRGFCEFGQVGKEAAVALCSRVVSVSFHLNFLIERFYFGRSIKF